MDGRMKGVLTNIWHVSFLHQTALSHGLLDTFHFVLVAFTVLHGAFFGLFERNLQRLDSFHCRLETFLQLGQLASQVRVVPHELVDQDRPVRWIGIER